VNAGKVFGIGGAVIGGILVPIFLLLTLAGKLTLLLWDEASTLRCVGNQSMTLQHKRVSLAKGPIVFAAGNCHLSLIDCEFEAPQVLEIGGNAHVSLRGGRLAGTTSVAGNATLDIDGSHVAGQPAMNVSGNALVAVKGGGTVEGAVAVDGNARVTGIPDLEATQKASELSNRWSRGACDGVLRCYTQADAFGNISGRLNVSIGADGQATDATYEKGDAPDAVRLCLIAWGKQQRLQGYAGRPGHLGCEYAGSLTRSSQRLSLDRSFLPDK
jgi:hypothetical protein